MSSGMGREWSDLLTRTLEEYGPDVAVRITEWERGYEEYRKWFKAEFSKKGSFVMSEPVRNDRLSENEERFARVATRRVRGVLRSMRLLGNCANRGGYLYTEQEAIELLSAVGKAYGELERKFRGFPQRELPFEFTQAQDDVSSGIAQAALLAEYRVKSTRRVESVEAPALKESLPF